MIKIKKITSVFLLILATAIVLCGCSAKGGFSVNKKTVCTVGGSYKVTMDEYKYFFYTHMQDLSISGDDDFSSGEGFEKVKGYTESSLKRKTVIMTLVDKYGIELTDEDRVKINDYVGSQIEEQGGEDAYRDWLLDNRLTGDIFRSQVELTFFYDVYLRDLLSTGIDNIVVMTPDAIYEDVKNNFYRYSQIFLRLDPGENSLDLEADIKEAYEKLESGVSFEKVAEEYSEWNISAEKGTYAAKGEKDMLLEETVLSLESGKYSEVVASTEGYHIFLRMDIDDGYVRENLELFEDQSFARRYLEYISAESEKLAVEYTDYYNSKVDYYALTCREEL